MRVDNELYQKQGIHVVVPIFAIDNKKLKVLLIKRKNEPFANMWSLVGGAVYNNEDLETAVVRELKEKAGIENIYPIMFNVFSDPKRAVITGFRMLAVGYVAVVDEESVKIVKETQKTTDMSWFSVEAIPTLAYDHSEILKSAMEFMKKQLCHSSILKTLFPKYVTIPVLQEVFEVVLQKNFDRRNFRKKLLSVGLISDSGAFETTKNKKPAKMYVINELKDEFDI